MIKAGTLLILFGGEDAKGRKLNDLHMFDLKSLMWLPLQCTGKGPSPRSNHVAAIYNDKFLFIFGGASKSQTMNDLYSLDFETMVWSRIKTQGFQPTPRPSCCGVLYGSKWYIAGGGSRKKRHSETLVYDVLKVEWAVAVPSSPSSVTANKNFSLVLMQHKEWVFLVAFGGTKKEPSNQVEILTMVKNEQSVSQQPPHDKDPLLFKNCSSTIGFPSHINNGASRNPIDSVARHNLASAMEHRSSGRKSLSESSIDPNLASGNVSLRKQFHQEEENSAVFKMQKSLEVDKYKEADDSSLSNNTSSQRNKPLDAGVQVDMAETVANVEEMQTVLDSENTKTHQKQAIGSLLSETDDVMLTEADCKSIGLTTSNIYQMCETKMAALLRKNGVLEGQLAAALSIRETAEKNESSAVKSRQDMERKLADSVKEVEFLKEKLAAAEIAQEEANSLSNIVHSDNVRLEHDVAFLKAVLDDTQKELHSTRGVLAGERARAFQLQVEVFHLKQRLQSGETRAPTPRKPFHA